MLDKELLMGNLLSFKKIAFVSIKRLKANQYRMVLKTPERAFQIKTHPRYVVWEGTSKVLVSIFSKELDVTSFDSVQGRLTGIDRRKDETFLYLNYCKLS